MTTYATLKADVSTWLVRTVSDTEIAGFLRLAEADIRRDVRVRAMETSEDISITSRTATVPTTLLSARRFTLDHSTDRALEYLTPEVLYDSIVYGSTGTPRYYTIEGTNFVFAPEPSGTNTGKLLYYTSFDALTLDADTNWLLANAYDVYLWAVCRYVAMSVQDFEQAMGFKAAYESSVMQTNSTDQRGRYSGSTLKRR